MGKPSRVETLGPVPCQGCRRPVVYIAPYGWYDRIPLPDSLKYQPHTCDLARDGGQHPRFVEGKER